MAPRTSVTAGLLAIGVLVAPCAALAAPTLQLSLGVDYSVGHYGAPQDTTAFVEPLSLKVTTGAWTFRALVPFATITGPGDVSALVDEGGGGAGEVGGGPSEETGEGDTGSGPQPTNTRSGISDISFSVSHSFDRLWRSPLYFDTTARIRFPTGDRHRGLGVGATDYFLDAELGADWTPGGLYVDFGRRFLGNLAHDVRVDGWQGSVGGWLNASAKTEIGASYDWREPSSAGIPNYELVEGYVAYRINRQFKIEAYVGSGLTTSSPRLDVGLTLIWRPHGRRR